MQQLGDRLAFSDRANCEPASEGGIGDVSVGLVLQAYDTAEIRQVVFRLSFLKSGLVGR